MAEEPKAEEQEFYIVQDKAGDTSLQFTCEFTEYFDNLAKVMAFTEQKLSPEKLAYLERNLGVPVTRRVLTVFRATVVFQVDDDDPRGTV